MAFFLASLTFLVVVVMVLFPLWMAGRGGQQEIVRRRLEAIEKAQKRGQASLELQLIRDELLSSVQPLHRLLLRWRWAARLREFVAQAGMKIKPGKLLLFSGVLALGSYLVVRTILHLVSLGAVAGAAASLLPIAFVAFRRWRRLRAFERNFPEAIDLLGRAVRAGHAFTTGLEMIGKELPEPVAGEFRITFEEQNFGLSLKDALLNLAERVPLIDVRFFVTALLIQKETGGNLAEILDNLSRVIRERFKILGEVRIRTAQGRMTAAILIALPPLMMGLLGSLNPGYIGLLFNDPWGPYMLATGGALQVIGSALLWKIVHIEV
ncbi:MAG TPA: type II secretion system F family protein [Candidatus Acidoferrales bacterium]